jgi:membrane protein
MVQIARPGDQVPVTTRQPLRASVRQVYRVMVDRFARNNLLTYASAIARQLLTAVIPLVLLAFLLVGAFGRQAVWRQEIGPRVADRASVQTYDAIDTVVEGLIGSTHSSWLVAAALILVWEVSGAVRACMGALNRIFELDETRRTPKRFGLSLLLAIPLAVLVLGAMLVATRGGGWLDLGPVQVFWSVARWLLVVALLWAAIAVLIRFAPDGHEPAGWITFGGVVVIVAWIGASLVFGWWVFSEADYKTPFGTAIAMLTLVGYLYTSAIVFLVGAQIDQLLLEQARRGSRGPLARIL